MQGKVRYRIVFLLSCICLYWLPSQATLIDTSGRPDFLLDQLVIDLDKFGIDVRKGKEDKTHPVSPGHPQLARLEYFPIPPGALKPNSNFTELFEAGIKYTDAYLVAVKSNQQPSSEDEFKDLWNNSQKDKRIFLSFSGSDINYAAQIATVLR